MLDVACGPTHKSIALAQREAVRVFAIVSAARMIELAQCRGQVGASAVPFWLEQTVIYLTVMGFLDGLPDPRSVYKAPSSHRQEGKRLWAVGDARTLGRLSRIR